MSNKVEVSKVIIKIGDKPIELTLDQARELRNLLDDMLGRKETVYIPQPYAVPTYPTWIRPPIYWDVYTSNDTVSFTLTSGSTS